MATIEYRPRQHAIKNGKLYVTGTFHGVGSIDCTVPSFCSRCNAACSKMKITEVSDIGTNAGGTAIVRGITTQTTDRGIVFLANNRPIESLSCLSGHRMNIS